MKYGQVDLLKAAGAAVVEAKVFVKMTRHEARTRQSLVAEYRGPTIGSYANHGARERGLCWWLLEQALPLMIEMNQMMEAAAETVLEFFEKNSQWRRRVLTGILSDV